MRKAVTVTAKLPNEIHQQVLEKIIQDRYGMRGKSKWVNEALESFLSLDGYPEFVGINEEMNAIDMGTVISVRIPVSLYEKLEDAVIEVRKLYPGMEGVKSKIIRTSLIQRILRGKLR